MLQINTARAKKINGKSSLSFSLQINTAHAARSDINTTSVPIWI
jgi:hypothetical protein